MQTSKQPLFPWATLKPFAWAAVILIFLLILLPFFMQILTFWKYDTSTDAIADQVRQQADQTQNLLNLMNTFAAIIGVIFAVFAAVTVALGIYGFSTNNGFRDLEKDWQNRLNELEQKSAAITALEEAMQQKNDTIAALVESLQLKTGQLKQLQDESSDLRDQLRKSVTFAQASLNKQLEEVSAAIVHIGTARNMVSSDPHINFTLGRILSGGGDYDRAIELLEAAALLDPTFPEVHDELGLAYRRRGDRHDNLGNTQKGEADYERAMRELELALRQNPHHVDALCVLGGLYRRKQDYAQAREYYRQAVQADPASSYALGNVASLAWYTGDEELAREMFAQTARAARQRLDNLESLEPYWDYFDLGLSQLILGETEVAMQSYAKAIELTPSKVHFNGVLHNLSLLKNGSQGPSVPGIDEVINMIERAR